MNIESLPDYLLLTIVKAVTFQSSHDVAVAFGALCHCGRRRGLPPCKYDHEFIVDVLSRVSRRFNRLSRDQSLWEDEGCGLKLLSIPIRDVQPKTTLESLPDELILKIVKTAALRDKTTETHDESLDETEDLEPPAANVCPGCLHGTCTIDHDFVANTVSEVSMKFNRIARDGELWREDKTLMVYIRHGSVSISSLPDNLILKIVKMAVEREQTLYMDHSKHYPYTVEYDHDSIVQTIAKISRRFRRIASHPNLWNGNIALKTRVHMHKGNWCESDIHKVFDLLPNDAAKGICLRGPQVVNMDEYDIRSTLNKFPSLERLAFYEKEMPSSWPKIVRENGDRIGNGGKMVTELYLADCFIGTRLFDYVDMSDLPNLKTFIICLSKDHSKEMRGCSYNDESDIIPGIIHGILLPDISDSNELQVLKISNGWFRFRKSKVGKLPLPKNLEKLILDEVDFVDGITESRYNNGSALKKLTSMCPKLKMLAYKGKTCSWPSSTPAWPLLEELYLDYCEPRGAEPSDTIFWNVHLHYYLPNLKIFHLTYYWDSLLPDMRGCKQLEHVHLTGYRTTPINLRLDIPFPKGLKKLTYFTDWGAILHGKGNLEFPQDPFYCYEPLLHELMQKHLPECQVEYCTSEDLKDDPDVPFTFDIPQRGPWTTGFAGNLGNFYKCEEDLS